MNHCRQRIYLAVVAGFFVALPSASTYGWSVVDSGANTSWYVTGSDSVDDDGGYAFIAWSSAGSNGVYTASDTCITARNGWNWYNWGTTLCTLDGWRKKQIDHCNATDTASYNWEVDLRVELSGEFHMDNDLAPIVWPLGDNEATGEAYIILTGMGDAMGNVKGTMTAEEGCGKATVGGGPVGMDIPIDLPGDVTSFFGDGAEGQTLSSSGTKPNAVKGDHIRVRGFVMSQAKCHDAAFSSTITCKTLLPTFSLTPN